MLKINNMNTPIDLTRDLTRKGRIHRVQYARMLHYQKPLDFETAEEIVGLAERLSPLDIKPEIYRRHLSRFQNPLDYDIAAEQVAERKLRDRKSIK